MDPGTEQWERVKNLFDAALRRPPDERERFLVERCLDEEIRLEVLSLLRNDESARDFLPSSPERDFVATASRTAVRTLSISTRLGPYEVTEFLGAGGMGEVYRAVDTRLYRKVAIKVLPEQFANDRERLRRFEQEARAVAALNHPNILALYDIGVQDGMPYVVSELLEGGTLRQQLANGPLSMRKAIGFGAQLTKGLSAAHAQGIVHRDLKPENIFITKDGRAKILDFGLAKSLSSIGGMEPSTSSDITSAGAVVGTAGYMSPEQVRGETINHLTDIFSFGVVLYEMISGRRAFKRDSNVETMNAILKDDPPDISSIQPQTPKPICQIVQRCLEKNPNERFHSAHDLAFALEAASGSPFSAPTTISHHKRRHFRKAWAFGAIALTVIGSTIGWLLASSRYSAEDLSLQQLTFRRGVVANARFAHDGTTVLYGASWNSDQGRTFMLRQESLESLSLDPPGAILESIFPSGDLLIHLYDSGNNVFASYDGVKNVLATLPITGGAPRPILENVISADISPTDGQLAIVKKGNEKYQIEYPPGSVIYSTAAFVGFLRFAPNGKFLAFTEYPVENDDIGWVTIIDISGKKLAASSEFGSVRGVAWAPNSQEVWLTGSKIRALRNMYAVSISGHERLVYRTPSSLTIKDISSDGRVLFTRDDVKWGISGQGPIDSSEHDYSWSDFSLAVDVSHDGKTLLFEEAGDVTYTIYIRRLDGSPAIRLGSGAAQGFSFDGNWILACTTTPPKQLFLVPVGAGKEKTITNDSLSHLAAAWFPDGESILFEGNAPGRPLRLFIQKIDGGLPVPLTPEGTSFAETTIGRKMISSDGQSIFARAPDGSSIIYRRDGSARRPLGLSGDDTFVGWSSDPDVIYDRKENDSNGRTVLKIYRTNIRTGKKILWKEVQPSDPAGFGLYNLVVSPDGKSYFYTYERELFTLFLAKGLK